MRIVYILLLFLSLSYASKVIEIDLSNQKFYAFEDNILQFSGNVSTGMSGYLTPRGSFKILEKDRYHVSNKYPEPDGGAKMPYMLRLTHSGVAIHQGYLPGYPASHGCIRVSKKSAIKLWHWSKIGTRVKIYGSTYDFIAKRKAKKKKHYASKKRSSYKKKRYKKHYSKKRYTKKRYKKRSYQRREHYVRTIRPYEYEVVELYDDY